MSAAAALDTTRQLEREEGRAAIGRLIKIAMGYSGQAQKVANFLLAWHNAPENGGWDPADLWSLDSGISADMLKALAVIRECSGQYPDEFGFQREMGEIWRTYRGKGADR